MDIASGESRRLDEQAGPGHVDSPTALDAPVPRPAVRMVRPETISAWGGAKCKITWRAPGRDCVHGAWQAKCPYHRRSAITACTKSLNLAEDTDEQRELTLRMVKNWLLQARSFDRAWKHQQWNPRSYECPSEHILDIKAEQMPALSEATQTDDELDARAARAALASTPTPKAKAKAKSKRKPKAKPKPKQTQATKRRAKPKAGPPASEQGSQDEQQQQQQQHQTQTLLPALQVQTARLLALNLPLILDSSHLQISTWFFRLRPR